MSSTAERIKHKGQVILNQTIPELDLDIGIWNSLNRHQHLMIRGWLGKGRVTTIREALDKMQRRIEQDNQQGKKETRDPVSKDLDPI